MAHWTEIAKQNDLRAQKALAARIKAMSISVPIGDSDYTAPGYLFVGAYWSCIPDAQYPWDPEIVRLMRIRMPDMMPMTFRSVWQYSNYNDHGRLMEPLVLVRHAIGRSIQNPILPVHDYGCQMPVHEIPGLRIPGRAMSACVPNFVEHIVFDRQIRPYGYDLPGAYLPFDFDLYDHFMSGMDYAEQMIRESKRKVNSDGDVVAKGAAQTSLDHDAELRVSQKVAANDERAYINRDINAYHSVEPSDLEYRDLALGGKKDTSKKPVHFVVPENLGTTSTERTT